MNADQGLVKVSNFPVLDAPFLRSCELSLFFRLFPQSHGRISRAD